MPLLLRHSTTNLLNCKLISLRSRERTLSTTSVRLKVIPGNLKGKSRSSQDWLTRQLNDPYVRKARYNNYRARSAFKLIEMDDKYKLLKPGMKVIECGAAPGAWTQVLVERLLLKPFEIRPKLQPHDTIGDKHINPITNADLPPPPVKIEIPPVTEGRKKGSLVVSIDKNAMHDVPGAIVIPNTDFTSPLLHSRILSILDGKHVEFVCSDMAPNASGHHELDHESIMNLCFISLRFSLQVLKPQEGVYLTKFWMGHRFEEFVELVKKFFSTVHPCIKPPSSRDDSSEAFIIAKGFKGIKS